MRSRRLGLVRKNNKRDPQRAGQRLTLLGTDWALAVELSLERRSLDGKAARVEQLLHTPLGLLAGCLELLDKG